MSRVEVAEVYGLTSKTLANWASQGIGPVPINFGREVRYHPEDVLRDIDERRQQAA